MKDYASIPVLKDFIKRHQVWRWFLPVLLMLLFAVILLWLPWQAQRMEANDRQEQLIADTLWVEQTIRFQLGRTEESLQQIGKEIVANTLHGEKFVDRITTLIRNNRELNRIVWLDKNGNSVESSDDTVLDLKNFPAASQAAFERTRKTRHAQYSLPAPPPGLSSPMQMDYHLPLYSENQYIGSLVATYSLPGILEQMIPWWFAQENEILLLDNNDLPVAQRAAAGPGRNVYTHRRTLDLPGSSLILRTNSVKSAPKLLPNLLVGSVVALSIGLLWSLAALWRDTSRRLAAEGALRQEFTFRKAMENSLLTGLRARDMQGRVTYVNPAFCQMVGFRAEELVGKIPPMPYWAPEVMETYEERFSKVLAGNVTPRFETIFQRRNGERFPVMVFESPLVDDNGVQTGWMGSILDISDLRRAEDLNRLQQEKLEASARLVSMGEIASTLAHELNQPLAAISSYTAGALNLFGDPQKTLTASDQASLKSVLEKVNTQAQRAGHIIRSVHAFIKKRESAREPVTIRTLWDNVLPLVELQARQYFVSIQTQIPASLPPVVVDATLVEQVLLNLTRNAIEAMQGTPAERRILRVIAANDLNERPHKVVVSIIDQGHGISAQVQESLFSPFFSTKPQGMGMGLNICRTTVEFHGGTLTHEPNPQGGTIFRFTLPALEKSMQDAPALASQ
ncbi:PAS domain S-box protein [Oxalobacteraceae bacterium R-40]|uniref:histidine kinase n=1 Tax=Keguizhuia sedimenti TaxID=3064264 RepID=A0ABU1BIP2_9BURK|nr:PAS domain S-box protein [Oxalobacteraceae bacterium R-40]